LVAVGALLLRRKKVLKRLRKDLRSERYLRSVPKCKVLRLDAVGGALVE
jgi:hypothetical protein